MRVRRHVPGPSMVPPWCPTMLPSSVRKQTHATIMHGLCRRVLNDGRLEIHVDRTRGSMADFSRVGGEGWSLLSPSMAQALYGFDAFELARCGYCPVVELLSQLNHSVGGPSWSSTVTTAVTLNASTSRVAIGWRNPNRRALSMKVLSRGSSVFSVRHAP